MSQTYTEYDPDRELERLYRSITERASFSYTPSRDPLYRSYADRAVQDGRLAMRDTVGRSAALTGGYGSSYAQTAGQQQYGEYLRKLGEALPEFYGKAFERYQAEQNALRDDYALARERRDAAYQRERDALADSRYEDEQLAAAAQAAQKQREADYNRLYKLISGAGYIPSDEELDAAGLSRAQAEALRTEYLRAHKLLGGASASAAASGGSGSKSTAAKTETKKSLTLPDIVDRIRKSGTAKTGGGVR